MQCAKSHVCAARAYNYLSYFVGVSPSLARAMLLNLLNMLFAQKNKNTQEMSVLIC